MMTKKTYEIVALHTASEEASKKYWTTLNDCTEALRKCGIDDAAIRTILAHDDELYSLRCKWVALDMAFKKAVGK